MGQVQGPVPAPMARAQHDFFTKFLRRAVGTSTYFGTETEREREPAELDNYIADMFG